MSHSGATTDVAGKGGNYLLDADAITRFEETRSEAVQFAARACEAAYPQLYAQFGERGREHCVEDISYHLDFLRATLESGDLAPFIAYLGWLCDVLNSRGVPIDSLPLSLESLADFYAKQMGPTGDPIVSALTAGRQALLNGIAPPHYDLGAPTPWDESEPFRTSALLGEKQSASESFLAALERSRSLPETAVHVIQPALYEIGRLWQENKVSVVQEHLASAIAQTLMAQGFGRFEPAPDNGLSAVFGCVAGNHHTLGIRMVADTFELAGWRVDFLGGNTPLPALLAYARERRPDLIGLSASLPFHLKPLRQAVRMLRAEFPGDHPRIVVGGLVLNQFPPLAASIGAELLGADAIAAVEAAAAMRHGSR